VAAYMIVHAAIKDREKFIQGYAPAASKLVEEFGGRYIIKAPAAEVLEGTMHSGKALVVSEWPDKATIHKFWNSPEYQEAKKLREGVADCEVSIVEVPSS
jgi:uncharacterized protein (DUF1330 family)